MKIIHARLNAVSYDIFIERGLLASLGEKLAAIYKGNSVAVIVDSTVDQFYGDQLVSCLTACGYEVNKIVVPAGEQSKSLIHLNYVYTKLSEAGVTRSSLILAFGGGVVGDLAGFAAATFLRGIPYVQVPTTLMAQLDSSIGGKTAVNLKAGKNLAGCFYHPKAVFIDPELLKTLPQRVLCDGLAEAVKYGAIMDKELFESMLRAGSLESILALLENIIYRCCFIKNTLVQKDELDRGERQLLNFGHTIGHGIEKYFDYEKFTHGEAVALGMLRITKNSETFGQTEKGCYDALRELLQLCRLPVDFPDVDSEELLNIIRHDKKASDKHISLILLRSIGNAYIHQIPTDKLKDFLI